MSKPVPRSRLNITYRTRIDGVPVKQKLPMRFLVLGDFSGGWRAPVHAAASTTGRRLETRRSTFRTLRRGALRQRALHAPGDAAILHLRQAHQRERATRPIAAQPLQPLPVVGMQVRNFLNLGGAEKAPRMGLAPSVAHEAWPGHHLQIAWLRERGA
jgi:hypothetical protein